MCKTEIKYPGHYLPPGRFLTWHRSVSLEAETVLNPDPFKELKRFYARTLIYIIHFQKLNFEKFSGERHKCKAQKQAKKLIYIYIAPHWE